MRALNLFGATVAIFTLSTAANAAVITVNIPEPVSLNFDNLGQGDAAITYDGVTFSQSAALSDGYFFNVGPNFSGDLYPVLASQQQSTGVANILISLPVASFGIVISFGTFNGTIVTFALSNGASLQQSSVGGGYAVPDVFSSGVQSAFTTVQMTAVDYDLHLSSITYFTTPVAPVVPEPASWALMIAGLGLVGATMRHRTSRIAFT